MYMEAIVDLTITHGPLQGYLLPTPQPVPIFTSGRGEALWSSQYLAQEHDAPTLESKTGLLDVESSAQPVPTPLILRWEGVIVRSIKEWGI